MPVLLWKLAAFFVPLAVGAPMARDTQATAFCGGLSAPEARARCLVETGKKPSKQYDVAALSLCGAFAEDVNRVRCLVIAREARSFEPGALDVCATLTEPAERLACLGAIAGGWYRPTSLRQCRDAGDGQTVRCLSQVRE